MTGILFAEEDKRGLKQMFRAAVSISFGPCLIIAVLVFIASPAIISLFGAAEYAPLAVQALRVFIIGFPLIWLKMFYIYYFQGSRNTMMSSLSSFRGV